MDSRKNRVLWNIQSKGNAGQLVAAVTVVTADGRHAAATTTVMMMMKEEVKGFDIFV